MIPFAATLIHWQDTSRPAQVVMGQDAEDFAKFAPYGYAQESVRAILDVDTGRIYALVPTCPDDGFERWTLAAHEAVELAAEAEILALPKPLRDKFAPGYVTVAERKAKRAQDDAEADARAQEAKAAKAKGKP